MPLMGTTSYSVHLIEPLQLNLLVDHGIDVYHFILLCIIRVFVWNDVDLDMLFILNLYLKLFLSQGHKIFRLFSKSCHWQVPLHTQPINVGKIWMNLYDFDHVKLCIGEHSYIYLRHFRVTGRVLVNIILLFWF